MNEHFCISRRNFGHWDVVAKEGRLFRLRGGPGQWDVIDERVGKGQNSHHQPFKEQSAAMAYICSELMHELLTVKGQDTHAMESWNIGFADVDPMSGKPGVSEVTE